MALWQEDPVLESRMKIFQPYGILTSACSLSLCPFCKHYPLIHQSSWGRGCSASLLSVFSHLHCGMHICGISPVVLSFSCSELLGVLPVVLEEQVMLWKSNSSCLAAALWASLQPPRDNCIFLFHFWYPLARIWKGLEMTYFPLSSLTFSLLLLFEMSGVGDGTTHLIGGVLRYSLSRLQCSGCLSGGCTCYHAPRSQPHLQDEFKHHPAVSPDIECLFLLWEITFFFSYVEASTHQKRIRIYNKERGKKITKMNMSGSYFTTSGVS